MSDFSYSSSFHYFSICYPHLASSLLFLSSYTDPLQSTPSTPLIHFSRYFPFSLPSCYILFTSYYISYSWYFTLSLLFFILLPPFQNLVKYVDLSLFTHKLDRLVPKSTLLLDKCKKLNSNYCVSAFCNIHEK